MIETPQFAPDGTCFALHGDANAPLVVLIHGLGLSHALWDAHLCAFEGFRVLTYDLYGHGASSPAPSTTSLSIYADQIAMLLDHIEADTAHVVGFSIGGMINRRFALDYPDKFASLVILNSPHDRGQEAQAAVEARAKSVRDQGAFSTFDAALKRWFTPDYLKNGEGPALVRKWREQVDAESYAQTAWVLANGVRELIKPDPAVKCPALVMTCENDTGSTPKMSHAIAEEIEGSETIIIPELQHLGLMENPAAFIKPIVDFLKRTKA